MKVHTVHVDGQEFALDPDQDIDALQREILEAAQAGAGFVKFDTIGRATVSVLITSRVGVRFEVIERDSDLVAEWEANPPGIDKDPSLDDIL
ncbi:hypothetical protein QL996_03240 [Planococcus sp. APC 4015]|nr:hypothetical protein [Planococcus sp. APC 4015]